MTAEEIIARLKLAPHPEGGHYRQTWVAEGTGRPTGTCIYFLLARGERSHWHPVLHPPQSHHDTVAFVRCPHGPGIQHADTGLT